MRNGRLRRLGRFFGGGNCRDRCRNVGMENFLLHFRVVIQQLLFYPVYYETCIDQSWAETILLRCVDIKIIHPTTYIHRSSGHQVISSVVPDRCRCREFPRWQQQRMGHIHQCPTSDQGFWMRKDFPWFKAKYMYIYIYICLPKRICALFLFIWMLTYFMNCCFFHMRTSCMSLIVQWTSGSLRVC